jgi:hypothetical protein
MNVSHSRISASMVDVKMCLVCSGVPVIVAMNLTQLEEIAQVSVHLLLNLVQG